MTWKAFDIFKNQLSYDPLDIAPRVTVSANSFVAEHDHPSRKAVLTLSPESIELSSLSGSASMVRPEGFTVEAWQHVCVMFDSVSRWDGCGPVTNLGTLRHYVETAMKKQHEAQSPLLAVPVPAEAYEHVEVSGQLGKDHVFRIVERRASNLTPAELLAWEIDCFERKRRARRDLDTSVAKMVWTSPHDAERTDADWRRLQRNDDRARADADVRSALDRMTREYHREGGYRGVGGKWIAFE